MGLPAGVPFRPLQLLLPLLDIVSRAKSEKPTLDGLHQLLCIADVLLQLLHGGAQTHQHARLLRSAGLDLRQTTGRDVWGLGG